MEKTSKKWFLKNIFRKNNKKENPSADFSSDEEDAKAGFYSADFYLKKFSPKKKFESSSHHNNVNSNGYHQRVYNPKANSEFCYFEAPQKQLQQPQQHSEVIYQPNDNEYHNFIPARNKINNSEPRHYSLSPRCFSNTELSIDYGSQASSQDEKISCNSYNQQQHLVNMKNEINNETSYADAAAIIAANKKTRAARNQRYYQRLLRDEGRPSTIYGCVYDDFNGNSNDGSIKSTKSSQQLPNNVSTRLPGPRYRGATLSDLDDYENILKVDEAVPPPIPPRDPNRRFSCNNSITKNPYYFDHQLQKYVVINKNRSKPETLDKPHYVAERKSDTHPSSNINTNNQRSNSTNDLVLTKVYHDQQSSSQQQQPKSYQRYNKQQRNLTITEGVKFPFSYGSVTGDSTVTASGVPFYSQDHVHQMPHKKFSSFEDINRFRGVNSSFDSSSSQPLHQQHVNQNSSTTKTAKTTTSGSRKINEKKTNLDDAINELEKMYSRLISDECLLNMSDHRKLPTLDDYSAMIKKYDEYEQEENRTDREPDLVKDDVFSRNIEHANKMLKNFDQLPFGIPNRAIQPIPPKPPRDYLSVKPDKATPVVVPQTKPDLIADDLAVRNLRRDNFANSRQIQSLSENMNGGTGSCSNITQILSPVTQKLHLGILSGARRPSGGKRREDGVGGRDGEDADAADSDAENRELEESLNALIIESKAISEKLEEDLSKMKATKSINRISSVDLLDFEKKLNQNEKETSAVSKSNDQLRREVKQLRSPARKSPTAVTTPQKSILKNDVERVKLEVQMVSTACSPIRELQLRPTTTTAAPVDIPKTPTKSAFVRSNSVERSMMPQASPKISELIQMFSNKESAASSSTTPIKPKPAAFKLTPRSKSIDSNAFVVKSKSPEKTPSQNEFESNIENIRDLIKQMKKTEFDLATPTKQVQKHDNDSREPSTDFEHKSSGTESINTTTSSLKTMESNESLPKIAIRPDELLTSAIERDAIAIDDEDDNEDKDEVENEVENENVDDNNNREDDEDVVGEKIVLRDESCSKKIINDVEKNINEDERPPETTTTPADDEDSKMTLEEKVKKQLENISLNLEKFNDENSTKTMTTMASKICSDANNNSSMSGQVLDVESLYNSTEELSMIFANAENYVSQGNEDDELDVLDADFVAASEKEFEKLVLDCNNNNSEIFDNQLLTNGDFALGMCPLSSVEAQKQSNSPAMSIINSQHQTHDVTDDDNNDNACSTQSTTIPKTQDNSFNRSTKALMKDERADKGTKQTKHDDGGAKQQQKKSKPSSSTSTTSTFNPLSTLQQQAFALACVYFIILLTQLLTFN